MSNPDKLAWEQIALLTELDCIVWNCATKVNWAKQAWAFITETGLANYTNEIERTQVIVRLLALAGIYADFYELAFEDGFQPDFSEWAEILDLSPLRVGQLIGRNPEWIEDPDDGDPYINAIQHLADESRAEVVKVLLAGFKSESELFISLWKSRQRIEGEPEESDDEIGNANLTPNKMAAFDWINEKCYPLTRH